MDASAITRLNLALLERDRLASTRIADARSRLVGLVANSTGSAELRRLLRDHRTGQIVDDEERVFRRGVDRVLGFYGLIEIGTMIGYYPDPMQDEPWLEAAAVLVHPDVRPYFEQYYRLILPSRFRARIAGRGLSVGPSSAHAGVFVTFLRLIAARERDHDVATFLRMLDGSTIDGQNWADVERELRGAPDVLFRRMTRSSDDREPVDCALIGIPKYLAFCDDLFELLSETEDPFRAALWHYNSYWFERLSERYDSHLGWALDALDALSQQTRSHRGASGTSLGSHRRKILLRLLDPSNGMAICPIRA